MFLPGEFPGQRGLVGYSPQGCKEPDMTKRLTDTHLRFWDPFLKAVILNKGMGVTEGHEPGITIKIKSYYCLGRFFRFHMFSLPHWPLIHLQGEGLYTEKSLGCFTMLTMYPLLPSLISTSPECFSSVQSLSCVWPFVTPWTAAHQAFLSITSSQTSLTLMSIKSVMPSSHLILCRPLLLLPPLPPSIRVFSSESALRMRWPKYWSFSFSIIPSKEIPGLISFRMDWLHLLAVQGTLNSLLQPHSSKASILRCSAFFTVQLSHPYMPWKNHSLD